MTTSSTDSRLWPRFDGPDDLAEVERTPLAYRGVPTSSYAALQRAASSWPDRPAITVLPDADRWERPVSRTFAQLFADVHAAAQVLSDSGAGRGDAVALLSVNCDEMITALLAAQAVGVAAPINSGLSTRHASDLVRLAGARVLVAAGPELDETAWDAAREVAAGCAQTLLALRPTGAQGAGPALASVSGVDVAYFQDRVRSTPPDGRALAAPGWDDVASFVHTGGTTGAPKLAARTHGNEMANAWQVASTSSLEPGESVFAALPLFHSNAMILTLLGPMLRGQHVLWAGPLGYRDLPLYGVFWRVVERYRIAAMSAVPTVYAVLSQVPVDADIGVLKYPVVGAAPLPPSVAEQFRAHTGVDLLEGYGLTEATCASSRNWPEGARPGTVGQRLPYQEAKAVEVDPETGEWTALPPGEPGTIVVRGPNVFAGYLRSGPRGPVPDPGDKVRDGWLDTGDLGWVDADGYITLAGRAKDLIIRGGHNIDPAAIEDALLDHPAVVAAGAVGQPDVHAGEVPVAYVVLSPGSDLSGEDLIAWDGLRVLERAAIPKRVEAIPEIPLTAIGKPYKPELRRRASERVAQEALGGAGRARAELDDGRVTVVVAGVAEREARAALEPFALTWKLETTP